RVASVSSVFLENVIQYFPERSHLLTGMDTSWLIRLKYIFYSSFLRKISLSICCRDDRSKLISTCTEEEIIKRISIYYVQTLIIYCSLSIRNPTSVSRVNRFFASIA